MCSDVRRTVSVQILYILKNLGAKIRQILIKILPRPVEFWQLCSKNYNIYTINTTIDARSFTVYRH